MNAEARMTSSFGIPHSGFFPSFDIPHSDFVICPLRMHAKHSSLIKGLDPAALFALDVEETAMTEWEPPSLEEAAKLFPQWKVIRLLGRGGMGAVYEMHQPELDRTVAVKLLPMEASGDEHLVERFRREARTLAKLRHPGIVALFESGVTPAGHFYFVMEHVNGSPLSQWIAEGRLDVPRAIDIVRQVCEALAYAHAQGVIHRDIKPSNILLDDQGHAKVADFGLARRDHVETASGALSVSRTGQFMGTPAYAAPEQVRDAAHVDHRADIYALGVLLYEMLTGDLPRGVFQPPSRKTSGAAHLDEVVRRALQERPEDRYQAATELQRDISRKARGGKAWLVVLLAVITGGAWFGKERWLRAPQNETRKSEVALVKPSSEAKGSLPENPSPPSPVPQRSAPASKTASTMPEPKAMPSPPATPLVQAWSLEAVSPALQPPVELTRQIWQDAVLTTSGGLVLHPDGSLSQWDESRPNAVLRPEMKARGIAISGNTWLALDVDGRLHDLVAAKVVAEGVKQVFSSANSGIVPALTMADEVVLIDFMQNKRTTLPKPEGVSFELTLTADAQLWCVTSEGALMRYENGMPVNDGRTNVAQFLAGDGFTVVVETGGRCTLAGEKAADSPQRFRLPAGTKTLRAGPQGRMVAW
jgi:serine/threonine protein kinase